MGKRDFQQDFKRNIFFLSKKGLRDTVVMVRSPFTGIVLAFVGGVGSVNYWFGCKNSEVLISGKR